MSLNFFSHSLENTFLFSLVIAVVHVALVVAAPEPSVELGFAANYVILAKTGISTIPGPNSIITDDIAVSPITISSLVHVPLNEYTLSSKVLSHWTNICNCYYWRTWPLPCCMHGRWHYISII
jgi:hypothetical protein